MALAGCSAPADGPAASCGEAMQQASYEAMRQLADAGLAADPEALRAALPGERAPGEAESVELPEYRVLMEQFDDAERAELLSALSSRTTGVGEVFDSEEFLASTSRDGACAGWLDAGD